MSLNLTKQAMRSLLAFFALMFSLATGPNSAQAEGRLSTDALLEAVNKSGACGADRTATSARYESATSLRVIVKCKSVTGFAPFAGLAALTGTGAAVGASTFVLLALGSGLSGSTPDTK